MGADSESARKADAPVTPFDKLQFAYRVSKTALNQGALTATVDHQGMPLKPTTQRMHRLTRLLGTSGWLPQFDPTAPSQRSIRYALP